MLKYASSAYACGCSYVCAHIYDEDCRAMMLCVCVRCINVVFCILFSKLGFTDDVHDDDLCAIVVVVASSAGWRVAVACGGLFLFVWVFTQIIYIWSRESRCVCVDTRCICLYTVVARFALDSEMMMHSTAPGTRILNRFSLRWNANDANANAFLSFYYERVRGMWWW